MISSPASQRKFIQEFEPFQSSTGAKNRQTSNKAAKDFSSDSLKFSGEATEFRINFLESYIWTCKERELGIDDKVKVFHHLLGDHALEFFRDNIGDKTINLGEIVSKMNAEFSSDVMMETIARKSESLHICLFEKMEKRRLMP